MASQEKTLTREQCYHNLVRNVEMRARSKLVQCLSMERAPNQAIGRTQTR